jgi:hypothetical protein
LTEKAQHWNSRGHFFAAAAQAMRRILVEQARRKGRDKHGGGRQRVALNGLDLAVELPVADLLPLDEALTALAERDAQAAQLVQLHCFTGLSLPGGHFATVLGNLLPSRARKRQVARPGRDC